MWVSSGTWGSNHMLNRLFGSFVLASGGQWPTLLDQQTKRGQWLQLKWVRFFSLLMESPVLNRVWPAESRSTQILGVRTRWGQGSAAFDAACGKQPERCPHNLPTALSSTVPLNLTEWQTTSPGMTGWKRLCGWEKARKQRWRWTGGTDKDVNDTNHQRNEEILSSFTYSSSNV